MSSVQELIKIAEEAKEKIRLLEEDETKKKQKQYNDILDGMAQDTMTQRVIPGLGKEALQGNRHLRIDFNLKCFAGITVLHNNEKFKDWEEIFDLMIERWRAKNPDWKDLYFDRDHRTPEQYTMGTCSVNFWY